MLVRSGSNYLKAVIVLCFLISCGERRMPENPNIIMIVADDLGWYDLGCYGNDFIETPNLDRLAFEGILFTDAYAAAPLCSPSRASLITGLHPVTVNITEHIHGNHPPGPSQKLKTPPIAQQLDTTFITIAEALKEKNYSTAFIGKWHLGGGAFKPEKQGFDLNIAGAWNGLPQSFFYPFFSPGEKPEIQDTSTEGDYLTDVLTDKALDYITEKKDGLFFMSLNYYSPHVPIEAKDSLVEKYRKKREGDYGTELPNIHYAAMVESIDINVGRVLSKLKELDIDENTIVVFTSDNGGLSVEEVPAFAKHTPPTDNGPLREGKGYVYEGGIREPLLVRWPAFIDGEREETTPVVAQDLFNTFMAICRLENTTSDGISLVPLFKGDTLQNRGLLWHLPHYSPQHGKPSTAYREGDWKLIHHYEDNSYELFNLREDTSESINLGENQPKKLKELKANMKQMLHELGAKFPEPNPDYVEE
ncbi:sulfatase [Flagellimonas meridianipacifica]|uniref:Arylsulfatase A-like enzyme n=1 Tax=Flagellimonas meridianipacifica TaxID=1080225 RepID=A0A2T0M8K8_9FLAO|nr:sulfatase [Allomuricauda pacifica]PRX53803.1 arylsulfatase A-like enzyme [Allomuricauda pacifica]